MRTNIVIDDEVMARALRASGIRTKREAVDQGLRLLARLNEQADLRALRGAVAWEGDLDAQRQDW
jgi:Arc/MetJ family transcription regulator